MNRRMRTYYYAVLGAHRRFDRLAVKRLAWLILRDQSYTLSEAIVGGLVGLVIGLFIGLAEGLLTQNFVQALEIRFV